ncbi:MAG: glycoside hydrolase family 36 N-terminal domain-containing protein, partial [Erysipelotrichaceae bacterium]
MITITNLQFHLATTHTSYVFHVTPFGHLQHLYYGTRVQDDHFEASSLKHTITVGSSVAYDQSDLTYLLDQLALEYVGVGKGDYRHNPIEVIMPDGSYVCDFVYHSHTLHEGNVPLSGMPSSFGADQTLEVVLKDRVHDLYLHLFYAAYEASDVISRR